MTLLGKLKRFATLLQRRLRARREYRKDLRNHLRYSVAYHDEASYSKGQLRCVILVLNHQLEKAQTFPEMRDGYGREKIGRLLRLLRLYHGRYGADAFLVSCLGTVASHLANPHAYRDGETQRLYDTLNAQVPDTLRADSPRGGVLTLGKGDFLHLDALEEFLRSRHSCRHYADRPLEHDAVQKAVRLAMTAPSACNRQSVRVHFYDHPERIRALILAQDSDIDWCLGARGLFVITVDRSYFRDYRERNQGMFDAGLFSMLLCLALHNERIGSCFKMAQKEAVLDKATKAAGGIPEAEDICVLLPAGYYPEAQSVYAKSARLVEDEILTIHE